MANNFLNMDSVASAKNTTEGLLSLLQLNNLLGPSNGGGGSGLNGGGIGGNNGPGLFGNGGGGGIGGLTKEQLIQQSVFYQQAASGGGGLNRLSGGLGGIGGGLSGGGMAPKSGRAITNAGNLANNHYGQQQQQQQQQQDIFSHSSIGGGMKSMKDMSGGNDYKQTFRSHSSGGSENNILGHQSKSYRNGDTSGFASDFGEFMTRDPYFVNMSSSNNQRSSGSNNQLQHQQQQQQQQQQQHQQQQQSSNQSFPPIGTFSIESVSGGQQSSNNMFGNSNQSQDIFGGNHSNMMNGGSGHGHANNGHNGHGNAANHYNNSSGNNNSAGDANQATRETGIIEKLLQHSYGFIQCCERQARLFFHFSQFSGNIEHLKIGDPVEFEMTYDRRTGKPIASHVTKIAPEVVLSEERVTGTVTTELKSDNSTTSTGGETTTGRISYENRGECFFLPYNKDDVEGNVTLCAGDKVSFQIATNQRGNLGACHIRLENPVHPVKYRGVVCSMKESFGFIERADVVKEIFFHFSEAEGTIELRPGDDVEFIIQTRNASNNMFVSDMQGKEVACNITRLPPGSVIFEDIGTTIYKGQVLKPLDRANPLRHNNDPLPGRIRYRAPDHSEMEVPFGDKDQKGDFTLRHGDWVQFLLATDRRDQLQRATSISLLDETFEVSGERREQGCVAGLKEGFGFLRCVDRNVRLFFHFTEVLDTARELCMGDEVEFTTVQDPGSNFANNRLSAIRIKHLPPGQVQFETLMESNIEGVVTREAPKSPIKSTERMEGGVITYTQDNNKKTIMYFLKDCDKPPRVGDQVRFDICLVKRNKELIAINIVDLLAINHSSQLLAAQSQVQDVDSDQRSIAKPGSPDLNNSTGSNGGGGKVYDGFIAVLKENFGFIETLQHDEEVFFHFSNFVGNHMHLELGQEVEYTLSKRNGSNAGNCLPAENVKVLPRGSIAQPAVPDTIYNGVVVRPLRCINPDQSQYSGLVQYVDDNGDFGSTHEFGITSLTNKRDLLQKNDYVVFKIDASNRAAHVTAVRQKKRANVDSIKGQFGFLDYEVDEGKKLFFHMTEVQGNSTNLYSGDCVEFSVVTNQRNGKSSACNVVKVADSQSARPERMLTRIKINSIDESIPRVIVTRQPKGPEGMGFGLATRTPRLPGVVGE